MDIIIHGTKGGRKIFTPKKISGLLDVTADGAKTSAIGKEAYAIRFTADNAIFSKYKIVRDVRGDKRTGFVGFSLFIPNNNKLPGTEIITLLDRISEEYCRKYIVDNNLDEVKEDWALFDRIADDYKTRLQSNNEEMLSGSKDDAFVYFKDTNELKRYFYAPFQEEYGEYRQILFIDKRMEGAPENPLNALRHDANANLTERIDLENKYYYLSNYNPDKKVFITANGKNRSGEKHNNCIRANWQITIRYSKDGRCYYPIEAEGKLSDPKIGQYLEIKGNNIFIKYEAFNNPEPITKSVRFAIRDRKGNPVNDAEITVKSAYQPAKEVKDNEVTFKGEELRKDWTVSVKKDDFAGENMFKPETANGKVDVVLIEQNTVTVLVTDEAGNNIDDFEVWTKLTNGFTRTKQIKFIDEQIIDNYTITIRKNGYEDRKIDNFQPHGQKHIKVKLKKITRKQSSNYKVRPGEHGKWKDGNEYYSNCMDGSDVKNMIVPYKGYEFVSFRFDNGTLVAQYRKKTLFLKKPFFIASCVVGIVAIGIAIFWLTSYKENNKSSGKDLKTEIITYVESDELFLKTLEGYITDCNKNLDSVLLRGKIDSAIVKRNYIDAKNFAALTKLNYSAKQQKFKNAVDKIDSAKYEDVGKRLGDVSALNFTQIADSINAILNPQTTTEKQSEQPKESQESKQPVVHAPEQTTTPSAQQPQSAPASIEPEIIKYLQGDDLEEAKLKEYKNQAKNDKLKKSIELVLKLWELNGNNNNSYSWMQGQINKRAEYNNLKNSALKSFLDKMCDTSQTPHPKYWPDITGNRMKPKTLKNIGEQK